MGLGALVWIRVAKFIREQFLKQPVNVNVALPSLAGVEIEFQVGIYGSGLADMIERLSGERRASQVRMQYHTGGIDDRFERMRQRAAQFSKNRIGNSRNCVCQ